MHLEIPTDDDNLNTLVAQIKALSSDELNKLITALFAAMEFHCGNH